MPVPTSITDLSTTAASNFPQSADSCGSTLHELPRNVSAIIKKQFSSGPDVTAANGVLTLPSDYSLVKITGAGAAITGFADCFNGRIITIIFDGVNTLTHSASFVMNTGATITTASGDIAVFVNTSAGVWQCVSYDKVLLKHVKVGFVSRDMTAASGSQAITGLGFKPRRVALKCVIENGTAFSDTFFDGVTVSGIRYRGDSNAYSISTLAISLTASSGNSQTAQFASLDSDGFTLTWTKTGAPTGTAYISYEAVG